MNGKLLHLTLVEGIQIQRQCLRLQPFFEINEKGVCLRQCHSDLHIIKPELLLQFLQQISYLLIEQNLEKEIQKFSI